MRPPLELGVAKGSEKEGNHEEHEEHEEEHKEELFFSFVAFVFFVVQGFYAFCDSLSRRGSISRSILLNAAQ